MSAGMAMSVTEHFDVGGEGNAVTVALDTSSDFLDMSKIQDKTNSLLNEEYVDSILNDIEPKISVSGDEIVNPVEDESINKTSNALDDPKYGKWDNKEIISDFIDKDDHNICCPLTDELLDHSMDISDCKKINDSTEELIDLNETDIPGYNVMDEENDNTKKWSQFFSEFEETIFIGEPEEAKSGMNDPGVEEIIVDNLFYNCDSENTGYVVVSTLIEYLRSTLLNNQLDPEEDLIRLMNMLDPKGVDPFIDMERYKKIIKTWIVDLKNDKCGKIMDETCYETQLLSENMDYDVQLVSKDSTECLKDIDISNRELHSIDMLFFQESEDSDFANEMDSSQSEDEIIMNVPEKKTAVSQTLISLEELTELQIALKEENEELKMRLVKYEEIKKELENRLNQKEEENTVLNEDIYESKFKIEQLLSDIEESKVQIKALHTEVKEKNKLIETIQDFESLQEIQLSEKMKQNEKLQMSLDEFYKINEELRMEYKNLQDQLIKTPDQFRNLTNQGRDHISTSVFGQCDFDEEDPMAYISLSESGSGSVHNTSIHDELMMDAKYLASPLCEKDKIGAVKPLDNSCSCRNSSIIDDLWTDLDIEADEEDVIVSDPVKLINICKSKYNPLLKEISEASYKCQYCTDLQMSGSFSPANGENVTEENLNLHSKYPYKKLVTILCRLEAENEKLQKIHDLSAEIKGSGDDKDMTNKNKILELEESLSAERVQTEQLLQELEQIKSQLAESSEGLEEKIKQIIELQTENKQLNCNIENLTRANDELGEKYHNAQLTSARLQETLEREKQICTELEGNLLKEKQKRQHDLQDIWKLVHQDIECMDDQNNIQTCGSSDALKNKIAKEIDSLKSRLTKHQTALKGKQMSLELGGMCRQHHPSTHAPSSPLVDALTIDFFDGKYPRSRQSKKACNFTGLNHHSFDFDKSVYDDSKLPPYCTLSCPSLSHQRRQSGLDHNQSNTVNANLTTSSSSSTSGIDISSSYHQSTDAQDKRRDFIRTSMRQGSSTTTSNSGDSNENEEETDSSSGIRRYSFKAAIENRKTFHVEIQNLTRNRSPSYHAAIEHGHKDCTEDTGYVSSTTDTTPDGDDSHQPSTEHAGTVKNDAKCVSFHLQDQNVYEYYGDESSENDGSFIPANDAYQCFDIYQNSRQSINTARKLSTLIEEDIDHCDGQGDNSSVSPLINVTMPNMLTRMDDKSAENAEIGSGEKGYATTAPFGKALEMSRRYTKGDYENKKLKMANSSGRVTSQTEEVNKTENCSETEHKHSLDEQSAEPSSSDLNALSPEETADPISKTCTVPSRLSQLRKTNLAKKREHTRSTKLPDLDEQMDGNTDLNMKPDGSLNIAIIPPAPTSDPVMPSISEDFLDQLGLKETGRHFSCTNLSDEEIETKFLSLSLAFKTDKLTLEQRKEIQERSRDIAEKNVDQELHGLRNDFEKLNQLVTDNNIQEIVAKMQNRIDILEQTAARVSSRAEVFGAVQQEMRLSRAMEVMIAHVENVKRSHEKDRTELEEAKKQLVEKSFGSNFTEIGSKRSMSVCGLNAPLKLPQRSRSPSPISRYKTRRRSEIVLPRMLGGSGCATLRHSASLDLVEYTPKLGFNNMTEEEEDPRQRFQAAVASTSVQNAVTTSLKKASIERQNAITSQSSLSRENSTLSRENSSEIAKEQGGSSASPSKQSSQEEEAYQKGYEDGIKTKLGKELNELKEQQNTIGNNIEEVMEKIEKSEEEEFQERNESSVTRIISEFQETVLSVSLEHPMYTLRFIVACTIFIIAVYMVILTFLTGTARGMEIHMRHHYYGMPPV